MHSRSEKNGVLPLSWLNMNQATVAFPWMHFSLIKSPSLTIPNFYYIWFFFRHALGLRTTLFFLFFEFERTSIRCEKAEQTGLSTSCAVEADKQAGRSAETELIQGFQRAADLVEAWQRVVSAPWADTGDCGAGRNGQGAREIDSAAGRRAVNCERPRWLMCSFRDCRR